MRIWCPLYERCLLEVDTTGHEELYSHFIFFLMPTFNLVVSVTFSSEKDLLVQNSLCQLVVEQTYLCKVCDG